MAVDAPGRLCAEASSDIFKPRAIFRSGCDPHQLMQVVATELAITWRFFRNGVTETKSSRGCSGMRCERLRGLSATSRSFATARW
jgi:hypothetical protein